MKKNYEVTEKDLAFLEDFLGKKYPKIDENLKIELIDHLILDFENTTDNGNLSQYLSNELEFIRKFVHSRIKEVKRTYSRETWRQFLTFFKNLRFIPYAALTLLFFWVLNTSLNAKFSWLTFVIVQCGVMLMSLFFGMINKKQLRKLDEVKYLGAEIWLPYLLAMVPEYIGLKTPIVSNAFIFTLYATFSTIYGLSAFLILRKHRKLILNKYKHLLS